MTRAIVTFFAVTMASGFILVNRPCNVRPIDVVVEVPVLVALNVEE
jgi:hypothetical protein